MSLPPEITVDGVTYHRFCFTPAKSRPGKPVREFGSQDVVNGILNLRGIDHRAEIDWFREAFGPELAIVTKYLGREPSFHWGGVPCLS